MSNRPSPKHRGAKSGIVQIAKTLGVSPSTVSRALRPETAHLVDAGRRRIILDLADRQRFSPNPGARMLRRGATSILTAIVPLDENIFSSEFYGRFLAGTLRAAAARDWSVQIRALPRDETADFRETLQHLGVDSSGAIYLAEPLSREQVESLRGYRRPLVLAKAALPHDVAVGELGLPVVGVDNRAGARAAIRYLHQLGHRRIALLLGPAGSRDAHERKRGYLDELRRAGTPPRAEWIHEGDFSSANGRRGMEALLHGGERPTAICCASDEIACGALTVLHAAGARCPEDFSVIGFDDGMWATTCRPALTTVRQPLADMAERAVAAIVDGGRAPARALPEASSELPASLVIRDSTRALDGDTPAA